MHHPKPDPEQDGFHSHLKLLEAHAADERVTLGEIERALAGRGSATLILVLALPFIQPVPVPGLSVPLGLVIAALALKLALGRHAGLPRLVQRVSVDAARARRVIRGAGTVFRRIAPLFRRHRLAAFLRPPLANLAGLTLVLAGVALALPLPPPILFSNGAPGWAVVVTCLGLIERDGLLVLAGQVLSVAVWVYFGFWWEIVRQALERFQ